ncbi:hypothetical protein [Bradyrhizobium sp. DASA03007]|uniref:hypothetical protein n=1 Tax=unclassified Bradyrhizobium TaxID=2631580 RepID=UPI003F70E88C
MQQVTGPDVYPLVTPHSGGAEPVLLHPLGLIFRSDIVNSAHHAVALIWANNIAASDGPNPTMPTKLGGGIGMSR